MDSNRPCRPDDRENLAREILGRVADKWTLLVIDALEEGGELRFGQIREKVGTISQKMLTKTLRQLERDGLVVRTVRPVIPPHVDYRLTQLGLTLAESVCGVWLWVEAHMADVQRARQAFDESPPVNASPTATPRSNRQPEA
jgi:DNA-binding HxlR family transcriptional regulator